MSRFNHPSGAICDKDENGDIWPMNDVQARIIDEWEREQLKDKFFDLVNDKDEISDALASLSEYDDIDGLIGSIIAENQSNTGFHIHKFINNYLERKAKKELGYDS